jgi:hypothetical protein
MKSNINHITITEGIAEGIVNRVANSRIYF